MTIQLFTLRKYTDKDGKEKQAAKMIEGIYPNSVEELFKNTDSYLQQVKDAGVDLYNCYYNHKNPLYMLFAWTCPFLE